jgi:MFS family permease
VVALLLTMNFVEAMNGTLLGLLIPVVAADFAVSTELAAWIQLGPAFTSAMFGPAIGMVADTIGRTGTWRVFAAVLMLSLPACGFAPDIVTLLVARTLGGMSWAGCGRARSPLIPLRAGSQDSNSRECHISIPMLSLP